MDSVLDMGGVDAFMARVHASNYFEEAAAHTLAAMLAEVERALVGSVHFANARIARGMVHVRPSDGDRQLVVLEAGGRDAVALQPGSARLTSTMAWRLVAQHRCAAAIDVDFGRIEPEGAPAAAEWSDIFDDVASNGETRQHLLERGTTHVYVLPLRGARGDVEGMISLEAECRAAVGQPFVWTACAPHLRVLADIATPHLAALPLRPAVTEEREPSLPVQDRQLAESLVELLHAAATAFVREAERRAALGTPLKLDLAGVFPGMVLAAATEKLESRDEAFRLFGRDAQVKSRNHHRVLRRELERVEALFRALGLDTGSPLGRLLEDFDG